MTKKLLLLSAIMLCLCLLLIACDKSGTDNGNEQQGKEETVTINFDSVRGTPVESVVVKKGEAIPKPIDPQREGYTLEGWYIDGEKWSFVGYVATKNMTLTANWEPITNNQPNDTTEYVIVTFNSAGGSTVESVRVKKGDAIPKPADPTRDGYTLEGWYIDGEKWSFTGYAALMNMTLTANWKPIANNEPSDTTEYVTVTFDKANGEAPYSIQVEKGTNIPKQENPQKVGYDLEGWYIDDEKWSFAGHFVIKNLTLTANWTPIVYTITYVAEGEHSNNSTYTIEDELELLYSEKNFSNCLGWYEDEEFTIPVSKIEKGTIGNKTFYAKEEYTPVRFSKNDNGYKVIGCDSKANEVVIPSIYNGKPVTSIGEWAFNGLEATTCITVGDGITSIGANAFYYCQNLTSITIGNGVTSIGDGAFRYCDNLDIVNVNDINAWCRISFASYDSNPLNYAKSLYLNGAPLTDVVISDDVTSIPNNAFKGSSLTSIKISDSVTSIGSGAFRDCTSLTSIEIPNSVTSISGSAFYGCSSVISVIIGEGVASIGDSVFSGCYSLLNIIVDEENTSYKTLNGNLYTADGKTLIKYAIGKKDTHFEIPNSVTSIGNSAFDGCTSLTSVTIGDSVTSIGDSAFSGCTSLTSVEIPNSVTSIGSSAFYKCTSLTSVTIPNSVTSIGSYAFEYCTSLTSVTIPNSVTSIGSNAFKYCEILTSVTIPNSVTYIGSYAFEGCKRLTIYCEANAKPSGWDSDWNYSNRPVVWRYKQGN